MKVFHVRYSGTPDTGDPFNNHSFADYVICTVAGMRQAEDVGRALAKFYGAKHNIEVAARELCSAEEV